MMNMIIKYYKRKYYRKGLEDAWKFIQTVFGENSKLSCEDLKMIFGYEYQEDIFDNLTIYEAMEMFKNYISKMR